MKRTLFPVFHETPNVDTTAGAQPTTVVETAAPAEPTPGPWAADAAAYFGDNAEAIASFDRYMREKQQPYITRLEEESAPARELYKDLLADPEATLTAVMEEIYGEDQAQAFAALLTPAEAAAVVEAAAEGASTADEPPEWAKPLLAKHEAEEDESLRQQQADAYQEVLAGMRKAHPDLTDAHMKLIHPFMSAAGGDTEVAYAGFQAYLAETRAALGVTDPPPPPDPNAELPPVLDGQGSTAAAPPTQKVYKNIDEAMDDWFAERRAGDPPPVL